MMCLQDTVNFCKILSEKCPGLSHLWIHFINSSGLRSVFHEESLFYIARLSSLESLFLVEADLRGDLRPILSSCPRLTQIQLLKCAIHASFYTAVSQCCRKLENFNVCNSQIMVDASDRNPDLCQRARNIIFANRKLKRFLINTTIDSCDEATLDDLTDNLENLKNLAFNNRGGFPEIGGSFIRCIDKFQNLSTIMIRSYHISQVSNVIKFPVT